MNGHPERENCREADERQARTRAVKSKNAAHREVGGAFA